MNRFIVLSFAFLGWAFFEISGGTDFQPRFSAAIAATDPPTSITSAQIRAAQPTEAVVETASATQETSLIVTRMIVADRPVIEPGVTSYSISSKDISNDKRLVFSLGNSVSSADIRRIRADNVNVRTGPGTKFVVVDKLALDSRVILLDGSVDGWVKLRSLDSGRVGWTLRRFLSRYSS